ncbi:MAG: LysR family transcriptional regulator, partial [Pseudomonadota bacterium]|nr:LysR family transcriptional regulator [Pseudomonadota bacterium]
MNLWQGVNEFVAVAESQNFTKAGAELSISTAQVSRQVRMLEERLGIKLLYRTTRRVHLTEAGQLYYQSCRPLIEA